jgi:hypothetical protein
VCGREQLVSLLRECHWDDHRRLAEALRHRALAWQSQPYGGCGAGVWRASAEGRSRSSQAVRVRPSSGARVWANPIVGRGADRVRCGRFLRRQRDRSRHAGWDDERNRQLRAGRTHVAGRQDRNWRSLSFLRCGALGCRGRPSEAAACKARPGDGRRSDTQQGGEQRDRSSFPRDRYEYTTSAGRKLVPVPSTGWG